MIVIGITGESPVNGVHAGKDTAAAFLREYLEARGLKVRVQAWADKLKVSAARALGFEGTEDECVAFCDRLKVSGKIGYSLHEQGKAPEAHTITGREFLEFLGTQGGRDVHGTNVWVDLALPSATDPISGVWRARHGFPSVIIDTTTRFPNEVARIREYGGQVWRIERPGVSNPPGEHVSKYGVPREDCDVLITNDGTLEDLRDAVILESNRMELPV